MPASDFTRWTSLGRPLDPAYPTNRAVVLLLPVAAVAGALLSPLGLGVGGLLGAGSAFLAWALTRELAPDDDPAAFVALALAVAALGVVDRPALLPGAALLLLTRVVNRTVGPPCRPLDTVGAAGLAAWAVAGGGGWPLAAAAALAFGADALLAPPGPRGHGALATAFGAWAAFAAATGPGPALPEGWVPWGATVVGCLYLSAVIRTRRLTSPPDSGTGALSVSRVRLGMLLPVAVLGPAMAGVGAPPASLAVVWAGVAAVAVSSLRPSRTRGA